MQWLILFVSGAVMVNSFAQETQFVFGGKQGTETASAYVGIQQKRVIITLGSDFLHTGLDGDYTYLKQYPNSTREQTNISFDGKAFLVIPHLGVKYFFSDSKKLMPYVHSEFFISFPVFKMQVDGSHETWTSTNGSDVQYEKKPVYYLIPPIEKAVKEALGFWGMSLCFGTEFFIDEQFSIGAEYGLRYFFDQVEYKGKPMDELSSGNIDEFLYDDVSLDVKFHLGYSYTLFSLNYYF